MIIVERNTTPEVAGWVITLLISNGFRTVGTDNYPEIIDALLAAREEFPKNEVWIDGREFTYSARGAVMYEGIRDLQPVIYLGGKK